MEFGAAVDVAEAALFSLRLGGDVGHALAIRFEPEDAAVDVSVIGVGRVGLLQGFEGGEVLGIGGVAECGCGVECGPAGDCGGGPVWTMGAGGGWRAGAWWRLRMMFQAKTPTMTRKRT